MPTFNRSTLHARDLSAIRGILKHLGDAGTLVLCGVPYTHAELAALFQSHIDSGRNVMQKRGEWVKAVEDDRALTKKVDAVYLGLREIVRHRFDNAPDALADFGMAPRKVTKLDPLTQLVAAEKRRATRAARHTMGKKQRLKIKGSVAPRDIEAVLALALGGETLVPLARPPAARAALGGWVNPFVVPPATTAGGRGT